MSLAGNPSTVAAFIVTGWLALYALIKKSAKMEVQLSSMRKWYIVEISSLHPINEYSLKFLFSLNVFLRVYCTLVLGLRLMGVHIGIPWYCLPHFWLFTWVSLHIIPAQIVPVYNSSLNNLSHAFSKAHLKQYTIASYRSMVRVDHVTVQ